MSKYLSLTFDNLSRTAALLEGYMQQIDEDPDCDIVPEFQAMHLEKKATIDERAATLKNLKTCEAKLKEYKKNVETKLKRMKELRKKLKEATLETMERFPNQPFRGNCTELGTRKTKGKVELMMPSKSVSLENVIDLKDYMDTDIPEECLGKATFYFVKKSELYNHLSKSEEMLRDAKLVPGKTITTKELL